MKIRVVEAELYHADGRTDRQTSDHGGKHNSRSSQFCEEAEQYVEMAVRKTVRIHSEFQPAVQYKKTP
jgi:hypothetical protein